MRFNSDSSRLVTRSNDRQIRIWRTTDGTLEQSIAMPASLESGEIFPDGRTILFIDSANTTFVLFDLATQAITRTKIPLAILTAFAFDPLGERFATVTAQQWGRIWSSRTGEPLTPPVWHGGPLTWVDWSPDGKRILMSGLIPEAKAWDAATGELALPALRIGEKPIEAAMWSLDGRFIVARSDTDAARVWDAATGEAVTWACAVNEAPASATAASAAKVASGLYFFMVLIVWNCCQGRDLGQRLSPRAWRDCRRHR